MVPVSCGVKLPMAPFPAPEARPRVRGPGGPSWDDELGLWGPWGEQVACSGSKWTEEQGFSREPLGQEPWGGGPGGQGSLKVRTPKPPPFPGHSHLGRMQTSTLMAFDLLSGFMSTYHKLPLVTFMNLSGPASPHVQLGRLRLGSGGQGGGHLLTGLRQGRNLRLLSLWQTSCACFLCPLGDGLMLC